MAQMTADDEELDTLLRKDSTSSVGGSFWNLTDFFYFPHTVHVTGDTLVVKQGYAQQKTRMFTA